MRNWVGRCSATARAMLAGAVLSIATAATAQFEFVSIAELERAGGDLKAGDYRLIAAIDSSKPTQVFVDLGGQLAGIYQGGQLVAVTTVSTGKQGYETPTGVFHVLSKAVDHRSNLYDAPMPFTQRLTPDGVSIHAGAVTGSPVSHGCIHMPTGMAKMLYGATRLGTTVTISDGISRDTVPGDHLATGDGAAGIANNSEIPES